MKKILFLLVLVVLIFPITVFAKTPTLEETLNVIRNISNVTVIDGVKIDSTRILEEEQLVAFSINEIEVFVPYSFENNVFSFYGGAMLLDSNNKVDGEIFDNSYPFFLYSILESKSNIPYDASTYYNTETIKQLVNNGLKEEYKESSNTFGVIIKKDEEVSNKYNIIYQYHLDGEYPVINFEEGSGGFDNPATGNYSILITILLVSAVCIGIYTYFNPIKFKENN